MSISNKSEVTYIDHMGSDLTVVNAARVSFAKKHEEFDEVKDTKLINFLARETHESPFTFPELIVHVEAPIFVARQLVKHKVGFSWNEMSRRYVDFEPEFFSPCSWRGRPKNKKQGSDGSVEVDTMWFNEYLEQCKEVYEKLLDGEVCPEQARMVLPQSTMTQWYWKSSLLGWIRMCNLRCKEDAQEESREVASKVRNLIYDLFPVSTKAWLGDDPRGRMS